MPDEAALEHDTRQNKIESSVDIHIVVHHLVIQLYLDFNQLPTTKAVKLWLECWVRDSSMTSL